jgi:hypothetical protein
MQLTEWALLQTFTMQVSLSADRQRYRLSVCEFRQVLF